MHAPILASLLTLTGINSAPLPIPALRLRLRHHDRPRSRPHPACALELAQATPATLGCVASG